MAHSSTHNPSPNMSDDDTENATQWYPNHEINTIMQAAAGPTNSAAGQIYTSHSTSTSSSSSLNPHLPTIKRKQSQLSKKSQNGPSMKKKKEVTAKMKDRQARGKDYGNGSSEDDSSDFEMSNSRGFGGHYDTYETSQRKRIAAITLDTPELLMMHASARGDSIPGTRHHFTKVMAGYSEPEHEWPFQKSYEEEEKRVNENMKSWGYDESGEMEQEYPDDYDWDAHNAAVDAANPTEAQIAAAYAANYGANAGGNQH